MLHLLQKVVRSVKQRGLADTGREIRSRLEGPLRRYWDGRFDRRFGTDTSGMVDLSALTASRRDTSECIWYQPVPLLVLRRIFSLLDADYSRFRFIDYGSGKGRALLAASEQPFREVIGVEFTAELHEIAERNIAIYTDRGRTLAPTRSVLQDAVEFIIPDGPLVCFLFTPFKGETMRRVLRRITNHAATNEVVIVYYGQLPENIQLLDNLGWERREQPMPRNLLDLQKYRLIVYSNRPHEGGGE